MLYPLPLHVVLLTNGLKLLQVVLEQSQENSSELCTLKKTNL